MEHTWYKCKCHEPGCMFCDGGLGHCTVCNGFEGTLTTDCCGRKITPEEEDAIYKKGTLDFVDGEWVEVEEPYDSDDPENECHDCGEDICVCAR